MESRKIIHIDMDAFFAAIEQRDHPELRGIPIAVGHDSSRGVVSTASYEARKYGVRSAISMVVAKRLCPHLVIVDGHHRHYKEVSEQVHEIFMEFTDLIEPVSIDEAFLMSLPTVKTFRMRSTWAKPFKHVSMMNCNSPHLLVSRITSFYPRSPVTTTSLMVCL